MKHFLLASAVLGLVASTTVFGQTSQPATGLGSVQLKQRVIADGKPLAAGTYQVRLTAEAPTPAVGQSATGERWVEFLKNGQVAGREIAVVVAKEDGSGVLKGPAPAANRSRVDTLKGGDYLRLWINRGGMNYIINLPVSS